MSEFAPEAPAEAGPEPASFDAPAEPAVEPDHFDPGMDEGYEAPPDISEAIGQLGQLREQVEQGHPEQPFEPQPYEEEPPLDDGDPYGGEFEENLSPEQAIERLVDQRVNEEVAPILDQVQTQEDARAIDALVAKYSALRNEQSIGQIGQILDGLADRYDNDALLTDPALVEMATLAHTAQQALASEAQRPQQETESRGGTSAKLESGAGPGPPSGPPIDPVQQAYDQALGHRPPASAFSR